MRKRAKSPVAQFNRAFGIFCRIDEQEPILEASPFPRERAKLRRHIDRLRAKAIPRRTTLAALARRPITTKCLEYFRIYGRPDNFRDLFIWLKADGVLDGINEHGKCWTVSETKVRDILHRVFDLYGRPGRKPKSE